MISLGIAASLRFQLAPKKDERVKLDRRKNRETNEGKKERR
jgi:hypothetical protein